MTKAMGLKTNIVSVDYDISDKTVTSEIELLKGKYQGGSNWATATFFGQHANIYR